MTPQELDVSRETFERLEVFSDLLVKWTKRINLIAPSTIDTLWTRHILDSTQLYKLAPPDFTHWLDFGSGGGLPGLVIAAIATDRNPLAQMTLVESDVRKSAFLNQASVAMEISPTILTARVETLSPQNANVISARAVGDLSELLSFAELHASPNSVFLFPKGKKAEEELTPLAQKWHDSVTRFASQTDASATIFRFERP